MKINRLTVDGKDYFLGDPVDELRARILAAIQAGGGYVNIPPLRGGPGIDILFSPGMPVTWTQIEVGGDAVEGGAEAAAGAEGEADETYEDPYETL
ncbi:MAG: hypothetical protein M3Y52_00755 [Actinomycetota bacterium]|nr:hypothetical protein [Actinomycetota bacterium]